ncbi:hypothetical protein QBC34DRAFT_479230 [Podospora aff. communis PSN243]|uniref:Heterokaryon incompatibility domain-containing protein n=1 Tax=Podospora aff. communis PSN243 TaxID=3040156 RepID=A0AAV9G4J3_9PEZI|nr:hypothetical protein QBC34DRAFT_479230 [Podospora aff. communis PSN243]
MEHLQTPTHVVARKDINIPHVAGQDFEAADLPGIPPLENFKGYPLRRGWKVNAETGDLSFDNRSPQEISSFLQAGFYFGCMITVFRIAGVPVRTADFLEKGRRSSEVTIRTDILPRLVGEWIQREATGRVGAATGPNDPGMEKFIRASGIRETLNFTFWYLQMFCQHSETMAEPFKKRMKLIELSIMAMGESLSNAASTIYGFDPKQMPTWGPSPILKERLLRRGWCPSDSPFFPEARPISSIGADYYFGSRQCPWPRETDHSTCSTAICNAYLSVVDPSRYKQRHVSPACQCEAISVPPEAAELVSQNAVPVVRWNGARLVVSRGSAQDIYIALSHVWADGLGNNNTNSLPKCQLDRIQGLVNDLCTQPHHVVPGQPVMPPLAQRGTHVPFWIDTLCVPLPSDLRSKAIRQMANTYRWASRVLVLDSRILSLEQSRDITDRYLSIHLSTWHHRLWTLQEGQLASTAFFQFSDGAQSFADMAHEDLARLNIWDPSTLLSPVRILIATQLAVFYSGMQSIQPGTSQDITVRLRSCVANLRGRQTSRVSDETLCLSSILGLDPAPLFKEKTDDGRMARFYDLVGRFDPLIIFHTYRHLPVEGYRWAPRSFLQQEAELFPMRAMVEANPPQPATLTPNGGGLRLRLGGFELLSESGPSSMTAFWPHTSPVYFRPWTSGNAVMHRQRTRGVSTAWYSCAYKMEVTPRDLKEIADPSMLGPGHRYAVILPTWLSPDAMPVTGVVGIIDPNTAANPVNHQGKVWTAGVRLPGNQVPAYSVPWAMGVRYVCRVQVSMPSEEKLPRLDSYPTVVAFSRDQEWCIR